jgi:nicotinate-nucleotide adenylyltransferase
MTSDPRPGNHSRVGILGGTLDPIHLGHVEAARAARDALQLDRVVVLPARVPPHRQGEPVASAFHRFAMAALCAAEHDWMTVSDDELKAPGPSFTAETLERVRASAELHPVELFFITGADAFAEIETWHRYPEVLDLAHFAVVSRPGLSVSALPDRLPALRSRFRPASARAGGSGGPGVFLVDARTPDVSSTEVRRRLASGLALTGLVCPAVARHIARHDLYSRQQRHSPSY